jgi:L-iditol 2-dehydrogenase
MTYEEAAFIEPLSVGIHACRRANVTLGNTVLITGCGPIGLVSLLAAKTMGASRIVMTDMIKQRTDKAMECGANDVILVTRDMSPQDIADKAVELLGCMPDVTIECTGAEPCIQVI